MMRKPSAPVLAAVTVAALIVFACVVQPSPILVWNASASAPVGLYLVVPGAPMRGDLVLVRTPETVAMLADERGYLPAGVPLIKHIAAGPGNHVCARDDVIFIEGTAVARQLSTDHTGRVLPRWDDCRVLAQGEFFLLNEAEDSFDSRYFGPVFASDIIERLAPLWTK
ncbi:peptidase S26 [mine drainage metagenome]|uniref:Peptidase S26 n=1 Tax=mine drainage metagenome TaxID=410659 RepID=A0A1J5RXG4_9ZZZZ